MGFLANDNVNEETKIVKRICLSLSGLQKHQFWEDCYFERKRPYPSRGGKLHESSRFNVVVTFFNIDRNPWNGSTRFLSSLELWITL